MHQDDIEPQLLQLHSEFAQYIERKDSDWILKLLEHAEWGLAFDTLIFLVKSENLFVSPDQFRRLDALGHVMEMDRKLWEPLRSQVRN